MAKIDNNLKFYSTNILGDSFTPWNIVNGVNNTTNVVLHSGGSMTIEITNTSLIKASRYAKVTYDINGEITDAENYVAKPSILMTEVYQIDGGNRKRTRKIGLAPFQSNNPSPNRWDTQIPLSMINQDLISLQFKVYNSLETDLTIYSMGMYRSQDLQGGQANEVITGDGGTYVECRTDDPVSPLLGREWLRVDLF